MNVAIKILPHTQVVASFFLVAFRPLGVVSKTVEMDRLRNGTPGRNQLFAV